MTAQEYLTSHGQPNNEYICDLLIGFAKYHVSEALKAAGDKVTITAYYEEWDGDNYKISEDNFEAHYQPPTGAGGKVFDVDRESIIKSYPLEDIK